MNVIVCILVFFGAIVLALTGALCLAVREYSKVKIENIKLNDEKRLGH